MARTRYRFMVLSRPTAGNEQRYLDWYRGQHIHDLLRIEGFVAAQFFRLADVQYVPVSLPQRYAMIWEIETDDLAAVFARVHENLRTGATIRSDAFDWENVIALTVEPASRRVTATEARGKSPDEVRALAGTGEQAA
ncbi:MAG TPA: hypothetical protein VFA03_03065 [Acetobacteraceae bacterium]|nr:hypothetical protein [Acetobacteraceae bacterium]